MTEALYLREDVFFCVTEGQGVFLDLKRDTYSAVPIPAEINMALEGASAFELVAALAPHRQELLDEQLVTEGASNGASLGAYKSIERPTSHVFDPDDVRAFGVTGQAARDARIGFVDIVNFCLASLKASRSLKTRHIRDVVIAVRTRKASAGGRSGDLDAFRRHAAIFSKLRPWYPRGYLCLFDALALVEFLARRRLYPVWVFGVQAQPFGAHCWVQVDGKLLNEISEYAGQFTPIMTV